MICSLLVILVARLFVVGERLGKRLFYTVAILVFVTEGEHRAMLPLFAASISNCNSVLNRACGFYLDKIRCWGRFCTPYS